MNFLQLVVLLDLLRQHQLDHVLLLHGQDNHNHLCILNYNYCDYINYSNYWSSFYCYIWQWSKGSEGDGSTRTIFIQFMFILADKLVYFRSVSISEIDPVLYFRYYSSVYRSRCVDAIPD